MVVASKYAVVIHVWCSTPPSLPTMVGMAVETMVWSRLESIIPAIRAEKMIQIRFWVSRSGSPALSAVLIESLRGSSVKKRKIVARSED